MKTLEDQGTITKRHAKQGSSLFLSKPLHEPTDNNSNLISTTYTVPLQSNARGCPNYDTDILYCVKESIPWDSFLTCNFKILRKCLRLNPPVKEQILTASLMS